MSTSAYDTSSDNFAVSPQLILGHLYSQYKEKLYLKAVSVPSEYAQTRAEVITKVKINVVNNLYN